MGSLMNEENKREVVGLRDLGPVWEISGRLSHTEAQSAYGFASVKNLKRKDKYFVLIMPLMQQ